MNNKKTNKHCCEIMEAKIRKTHKDDRGCIDYEPQTRLYSFRLLDKMCHSQIIYHCPWCGAKLPKELTNEWEEIIAKEFGITEFYWEHEDKLPPEFKTEEWWKKRGL